MPAPNDISWLMAGLATAILLKMFVDYMSIRMFRIAAISAFVLATGAVAVQLVSCAI